VTQFEIAADYFRLGFDGVLLWPLSWTDPEDACDHGRAAM